MSKKNILLQYILISILILLTFNIANASGSSWLSDIFPGFVKNSMTTVATLFANFDKSGRVGIALIKLTALIAGIILIFLSGIKMIRFSDGKEQMSSSFYTFIGGLLLVSFVPSIELLTNTMAIGMGNNGTGGITNGLALANPCHSSFIACTDTSATLSGYSIAALTGVITFLRLIGYIAVFRGIYGLYEMGKGGGGGSTSFWKSVMFMIGGTACINVIAVAILLGNTLAPNSGFTNFLTDTNNGLVSAVQ